MLADHHRLAVGSTSMVGYAISNKEARIASDVEMENIRYANPHLPETRSELAIPLVSGDRALGAITVQSAQAHAFDQDDIVVFQGIADSLAVALENARLFQQLQDSLQEIQEVHRQYIRQSWLEVTDRTHGISYTYDRAITEKDALTDQEIFQPATMEIPLVLRDEPIGYLSLETARPTLTPQEKSFIESVVQQTALALENIRLVEETQRVAQQASIVSDFSDELSRAMDVERVLKTAVRELGRLPNISEVSVHIDPSPVEER
jgi:GAF domain-containing protein